MPLPSKTIRPLAGSPTGPAAAVGAAPRSQATIIAASISETALGGIAVPGTPLRMMRATSSSVLPRRNLPLLRAVPGTWSPAVPWQPAQVD